MNALASRFVQAIMVAVLIGTATFVMMRSLPGDARLADRRRALWL